MSLGFDRRTTIAKITSNAPSAIAVLVLDGPEALSLIQGCWIPYQGTKTLEINRIRYGHTVDLKHSAAVANAPHESIVAQESIVVCRTSADRIEIHCHGGKQASNKVMSTLVNLGAVEATWSEIANGYGQRTRTYEHGLEETSSIVDQNLIAQEAIEDLLKANTIQATSILLDQMRGSLSSELLQIVSLVKQDQRKTAIEVADGLRQRFGVGQHLIHPWRVVLAGPPNVGKSSLLNRLLGYERAIVHEQAGTTRDSLKERTSFQGWPIELIDGAGVRDSKETSDMIERDGIARTLEQVSNADCTLFLVDRRIGWTDAHSRIEQRASGKKMLILTKTDLGEPHQPSENDSEYLKKFDYVIKVSSLTGDGMQELQDTVVQLLLQKPPTPGTAVPFRSRHIDLLDRILAS